MWESDFGDIFETEEDAREDMMESMTWDDYEEYFFEHVPFHRLFTTLREKVPDFFELFEDEFCAAEEEFFHEHYEHKETEGE